MHARSSDPAPGSRAFPWPVLEQGNSSFAEGVYSVSVEDSRRGRSFNLTHKIDGADLISRWIAERKVRFACAVAAPTSAYRELHLSDSPTQPIRWNPDDLGEPPMFTPMIVAALGFEHAINASADGVSPLWDDKVIQLPKGARAAIFPTFGLQPGMSGILDFRLDEKLESGSFRIESSVEDGFRFKVNLAKDLLDYLRGVRKDDPAGANIMTHIVSAAFNQLKEEYGENDGEEAWRAYPNLLALAAQLESQNLKHWAEDGFSAEETATTLHPHILPAPEMDD